MIVTLYEVAGTQIAPTDIAHIKVIDPAVSMRPKLSLIMPMNGLPIAVPKLRRAVIVAD
jgi:hypothetical protein